MRALVKAQSKPGLWLEEVAKPEVGPEDVLIKRAFPFGDSARNGKVTCNIGQSAHHVQ